MMEQVEEHRTTVHRKRVMSNSSSFSSNRLNSTQKSSSTQRAKVTLNGSFKGGGGGGSGGGGSPITKDEKSDEEKLKEHGISIVESNLRNFANISPVEVTDYYKGLGQWQDVLPKTDYAYSPMSAYNKMKINGVYPVVPNMSRRRLWSDHYDSTEIHDNELNSFYAKKYRTVVDSSTTTRRWFVHKDNSSSSSSSIDSVVSSSSSSKENLRQWISNKRSSFAQFSSKFYRRWRSYYERMRTRTATSSLSRSWLKILVQNVFPSLLILCLILYLFLWSHLSSSIIIDYLYKCSVLVYKLVESLFTLVYRFVDVTLASATFTLSCISWPRDIPDFVFAPLYQELRSLLRTSDEERTKTAVVHLDDDRIEELFRRLFDASSTEFTRKVDDKLREYEERRKRGDANLEARLRTLEKLVSEQHPSTNTTEQIRELREEVVRLRQEIRTKETKIENDFFVLLSTVVRTEPGEEVNWDELKTRFAAVFRSVEEAHFKVDRLNREFANYVNNASERVEIVIERSRERVKRDLRATVEELTARKLDEWRRRRGGGGEEEEDVETLERYVKKVVQQALDVYDADKTGMADYALESSGGVVLSTRCTETKKSHAQFSILGIPFWQTSTSPRTVIQPGVHPGECWAFPGSTGYLVVQLSQRIYVTAVTLEHIPKAIALNGTIDSAPKDFSVWALRAETDPEAKLLGQFRYDEDGASVQRYDVAPLDQPYQIVELKILSNHGRVDYTCLYRFRVHGIPV